jgi:RNA polymerase sigma factor (TIGR02999 family)
MIPRIDETPRSGEAGRVGEDGDPVAAEALFATLYAELHRMARREVRRRAPFVTLGATTLVHEAYLGLSGRRSPVFPDRARFLAYAARTMRGLIIDHVRRRRSQKRGGLLQFTSLDTAVPDSRLDDQPLQDIGKALDDLAAVDSALAQVVDLKFFCGFSFAEIGTMHGVSERTVQRQWEKARAFLHHAVRIADAPRRQLPAAQVA